MSALLVRLFFGVKARPSAGGTAFTVTPRWFTPTWLTMIFMHRVLSAPATRSLRVWGTRDGEEVDGEEWLP